MDDSQKKPKNPHKTKLITSQQAAHLLRSNGIVCDDNKITRWCREKRLKKSKKVGGQWYVSEAEIRGLVEVEGDDEL